MKTSEIERRIENKIQTVFKKPPVVRYKHRYTHNYFTGLLVSIANKSDSEISQGYTCFGIVTEHGGIDTSDICFLETDKDKIEMFKSLME